MIFWERPDIFLVLSRYFAGTSTLRRYLLCIYGICLHLWTTQTLGSWNSVFSLRISEMWCRMWQSVNYLKHAGAKSYNLVRQRRRKHRNFLWFVSVCTTPYTQKLVKLQEAHIRTYTSIYHHGVWEEVKNYLIYSGTCLWALTIEFCEHIRIYTRRKRQMELYYQDR